MSNLLLSGAPGVGKTTIMRRVAQALGDRPVSGIITKEIRRAGERVGFTIESLDGHRETMAHLKVRSTHRVGRYGVDLGAIDRVVARAFVHPADVVLIDEIGKMECYSPLFVDAVTRLLEGPRPVVATVGMRGKGLIARIKERDDVELWEVTRDTRDLLPLQVVEWVEERLS
jgi:nucleoside-triphosphatase